MHHASLTSFTNSAKRLLKPTGPHALILLEDEVEVDATIEHCRTLGFEGLCIFGLKDLLPRDADDLHCIEHDMRGKDAMQVVINAMIRALPDSWLFYCFNSEFLYFPFCETRTIREMIAFNIEERRDTILSFVVDLYSNDLGRFPDAVSHETAHLDRSGYFALARLDAEGHALERQLDFFGGLRWRFEEHIPKTRRKIDRVNLFRAKPGLKILENHTFSDPEYNTYACAWHNNISTSLCSFRTAKALMSNPGSKYEIPHFWCQNSTKFEWHSNQLLELGLMEPGQWF